MQKKEQQFEQEFETGSFCELWAFARKRHLDQKFKPDEEDALTDYIKEQLGMIVREDDNGILGVDTPDQGVGEYRYKRGRGSEVSKMVNHKVDDKGKLDERFEGMCDKGMSKAISDRDEANAKIEVADAKKIGGPSKTHSLDDLCVYCFSRCLSR